ncbi:glycosyltransferase [Bacillus sp. JJ634]
MSPKISIIVPIYNVEKYLSRCLDSLLSQTIHDIEIIAVNDESTDSSLKILREYKKLDPRIKSIDKPNGGVSSARNVGISHATGQYIGFVDPDDWVENNMYQSMYQQAIDYDADIVMCSYIREFENHSKEKIFNLPGKVFYQDEELKTTIMRRLVGPLKEEVSNPELLDAWGTVWSKLYRREIIMNNHIRFTDLNEIGTNEDSLFNIEAFYYATSFVFINLPYYHYWRGNETSVTSSYKPNLLNQWFVLYNKISFFLKSKEMNEEFYQALNNRICLGTLGLGLNTVSKGNEDSFFKKIKKLNNILNDDRIQRSFEQFELVHFSIAWKAFYFCAKTKSAIAYYCMLVSIEWLRKIVR